MKLDKQNLKSIAKVAAYVGASAIVDYLISITGGTEFGTLTPIINIILVTVRKALQTGDPE